MKQPRKLKWSEKVLLSKRGYDPKEWMFISEDTEAIYIQNKKDKEMCIWVEK